MDPSNREKGQKMPFDWLAERHPNEAHRLAEQERRLLGTVPPSIADFDHFFDARRVRLRTRIEELLGTKEPTITTM